MARHPRCQTAELVHRIKDVKLIFSRVVIQVFRFGRVAETLRESPDKSQISDYLIPDSNKQLVTAV